MFRDKSSKVDKKGNKLHVRICTCGHVMVLRTNRKTGEKFWGCSTYPECTLTQKTDEELERIARMRAAFNHSDYDDGDYADDMELADIWGINGYGDN